MKTIKKASVLLLALCLALSIIPAFAAGDAPEAVSQEIKTYRGVSVGGKLVASDPSGLDVTFEITTEPIKGTVELSEDGSFVYTPRDGKKGRDYFGFRAVNSDGVASQEATVIIRIEKQKNCMTYSDMDGNGSEYAALVLAENGVYTGSCLGGSYVFRPDETVTRAEFLAMCMNISGDKLLSDVAQTGFSDDIAIPAWAKPYVSTALMNGYISGYSEDGSAVFSPDKSVTRAEAAVMLSDILGIYNLSPVATDSESAVPAWCASQINGLISHAVISDTSNLSECLTRAECAEMLAKAISLA
jgi:hypothetical protein